jgi:hypothetical protein
MSDDMRWGRVQKTLSPISKAELLYSPLGIVQERQRCQSKDVSHRQESFTASQAALGMNTAIHVEVCDCVGRK